MNKMNYVKLRDITTKITKGTTPSNIGADFTNIGINYFRSEMLGKSKYLDKNTGLLFISEETHNKLKRSQIKANDLLFSMAGAYLGKLAIVSENDVPANTNQAVAIIRFKENINIDYIYYFMSQRSFTTYVNCINAQAAQPNINLNQISKLQIAFPNEVIQTKIASILSAYDDLIENNNKRIKILEQMAENLYKEWFVRFRFPGYETAEFENGIPKGWDIVKLKKIAKLKSGYAFKSEWWTEIGVPVIKIKDIQDGKITLHQLDCVSKENAEKAKKFMVQSGDLLIALTGATIGKTALIVYEGYLVNQRVGKFFVKNPSVDYIGFLYCLINRPWIQEKIICYAGSNAAQPNISPLDIENFKILYNKEIVDKFNLKMKNIIKMIISLQKTNFLLIKQRDLLLPRLMSGKLEV